MAVSQKVRRTLKAIFDQAKLTSLITIRKTFREREREWETVKEGGHREGETVSRTVVNCPHARLRLWQYQQFPQYRCDYQQFPSEFSYLVVTVPAVH